MSTRTRGCDEHVDEAISPLKCMQYHGLSPCIWIVETRGMTFLCARTAVVRRTSGCTAKHPGPGPDRKHHPSHRILKNDIIIYWPPPQRCAPALQPQTDNSAAPQSRSSLPSRRHLTRCNPPQFSSPSPSRSILGGLVCVTVIGCGELTEVVKLVPFVTLRDSCKYMNLEPMLESQADGM